METSTVIAIAIVSAVEVAVCCCCCFCFCCCCCKNSTPTGKTTAKRRRRRSPGNLESGWFEPTQRSKGIEATTKGIYRPVESDGPEDYKERPVVHLPYQLHNFVVQQIIPYFNDQRLTAYQFAVVVLLSESDFDNICQTNFTPSDIWGRPILNKAFSVMPQDLKKYGNYVVARPSSNDCHSEEEIFGKYSVINTPFYHLWSAYVERNGAYPKCILIYSWNLPCSRCTEAIIRSLGEKPYNGVSVIVAHTIFWMRSESDSQHKMNQEKLISKNITVEQVQYPVHLPPGQITSTL